MIVASPAPTSVGAPVAGWLSRVVSDADPDDMLKLLRENKYPLLSLDPASLPRELVDSTSFKQALEADREWMDTQRAEYEEVQRAWADRGIPAMFIKTACIPPAFPYTSDNLDVMVPEERGEEAKRVLREKGFLELRNIEEPKKYLFRKFKHGRSVCAVHIHNWVGWNINFFEEDSLWRRSRVAPTDDMVTAPSPEDALLINLAHAFYENKRFTLHDLEKIRVNWNEHTLDWDYLRQASQRRGWYDGFLFSVLIAVHLEEALTGETRIPARLREEWERDLRQYKHAYRYLEELLRRPPEMPFKVSFMFSKNLYYRKIWHDKLDSLKAKTRDTLATLTWGFKLKAGIRPQPSVLVTLSGLDGSGKSEQSRRLMELLELVEVKRSHYWNRIGDSIWTRFTSSIVRLASPKTFDSTAAGARRRVDLTRRSRLVRGLWAWQVAVDLALRYAVRLWPPLILGKLGLGRVVVSDRYLIDAETEILCRTGSSDPVVRLAIRFLRLVSPRPSLQYVLDVPEDVALSRRTLQTDDGTTQKHRDCYLQLAGDRGIRVLDGTRVPGEIADEITTEVLEYFEARYSTVLNGLLWSNPGQRNPKKRSGIA